MSIEYGDPRLPPRFWAKVQIGSFGCWVWQGYRLRNGYGRFHWDGKPRMVHRVAYAVLVEPIPEGLTIDHVCHQVECVNPAHLEPTTNRENILRGNSIAADRATRTHCPAGHPLVEGNLRPETVRDGRRGCLTCRRDQHREKNRLMAAAARQLGLTHTAYAHQYGSAKATAQAVLEGTLT